LEDWIRLDPVTVGEAGDLLNNLITIRLVAKSNGTKSQIVVRFIGVISVYNQ
jgi:hypothetical protein